MQDSRMYLGLM